MRINKKHFIIFRNECEKQLVLLGLKGWKVYYQLKPLKNCFGRAEWDFSGRVATITMSSFFPKPFDDLEKQIKETALHECLEIFLGGVSRMAGRRDFIQEDFDSEIHNIIRTLEKLLYNHKEE